MSAKPKIFIDGEHGTTGLQIRDRLARRDDIELISLPEAERRNVKERGMMLNAADIAILCLPDDASREAMKFLEEAGNATTRVIDTSTAHRTHTDWTYGFAELTRGQRAAIAGARLISNPGCYATGAIALLRPLVEAGLLSTDYPVAINAVSGYTGGGKALIAQMEDSSRDDHIKSSHYLYALPLAHKHVPEIMTRSGLTRRPIFTPNVGRFPQGMLVNIPFHLDALASAPSIGEIHAALEMHYSLKGSVEVVPLAESAALTRIEAEELAGKDTMRLYVLGAPDGGMVNLVASLDNLGKGASGAAVQNLDIMLGR
jgi:N-acetyl-gamma-glutamyl-phosphate reductase